MIVQSALKKLICFCTFLFIIGIFGFCRKKAENNSNNPNTSSVYVNLYIYVNTPEFFPLNTIGGWTYKEGGERGIVIYRNSQTDFVAFDRTCPHDGENNPKAFIKVLNDNITAVDSVCGSKYYVNYGGVIQGPSVYPLKAYRTSFDGNALHIYN